jgi:hypothetical protein
MTPYRCRKTLAPLKGDGLKANYFDSETLDGTFASSLSSRRVTSYKSPGKSKRERSKQEKGPVAGEWIVAGCPRDTSPRAKLKATTAMQTWRRARRRPGPVSRRVDGAL